MGRRGPPATPTNILEMRGSKRAKQRKGEPKPKVGAPAPPAWLATTAKTEWTRVVAELVTLGVVTALDRQVLATYCQAVADVERLTKRVRREGEVITGAMGGRVKNPRVMILKEAYDRMLTAERELGLTPASRTRVKADPQSEKDKGGLAGFIGSRRSSA